MTWRRMTWRSSLRAKIAIGFTVVLVLHVSIALLGHFGLDRAKADLQTYEAGGHVTRRTVEADRLVRELQSTVRNYTHTGHQSVLSDFEDLYEKLRKSLREIQELSPPRDDALFPEMHASLATYKAQFEKAVVHRTRRAGIVDEKLPKLSRVILSTFEAMRGHLTRRGDGAALASVHRAQRDLEHSMRQTQVYLNRLDSSAIRRAQHGIAAARRMIREWPDSVFPAGVERRVLADSARGYSEALPELVQSTRSYLHLIHVVMAAEAAAILRTSNEFRDEHLASLEELSAKIKAEQDSFQSISLWISILTIAMGLLASSLIARVVSKPIAAITATFKHLAQGGSVAEIPSRERTDEIGELAEAAQVFHERNVETSNLLAETQRLQLHSEKIIANLERTNEELDSFAHVASHDMKAPVRAMSALVSFLEEDCGEMIGEEGRQHLDALKQRIGRMRNLLEDLLCFSRSSRAEFDQSEVGTFETIRRAFANVGDSNDMELIVEGDDVRMYTHRIPLEMILGNLISNACKHRDRETGRIWIRATAGDDVIAFRVADDGPGIPVEYREQVFRPFQTLKRRDEVEASGMGLALVRKLVRRFGKSIECLEDASVPGACFVFEWPWIEPGKQYGEHEADSVAGVSSRVNRAVSVKS